MYKIHIDVFYAYKRSLDGLVFWNREGEHTIAVKQAFPHKPTREWLERNNIK